ncbi:MAG: MBL fold metallo-hydrolase [bacterium]|nr:MBL fold metallo-hydrolase [bacterium]
MRYKNLDIQKLNHASVKIKNSLTIYFDPFKILDKEAEPADLVFITHEHFDHCSPEDLKKIIGPETILITISACQDNLSGLEAKEIKYVKPMEQLEIKNVRIEVVPAYNINKFRSPGIPFHPLGDEKVGFVVTIDGVKVYFAGDTDNIPEMANLKNIDIAFLPVSGTYVMTAEEAASAVKIINPKIAIPLHYGDVVGTVQDAERFKELSSVLVEII